MQTKMFVFPALQNLNREDALINLCANLTRAFADQQVDISFSQKNGSVRSRFGDVSYYISIFEDKKELKDWYQMAKNFELTVSSDAIDDDEFERRVAAKKAKGPDIYEEMHYSIARTIYQELRLLDLKQIHFFC